MDQREQLFVHKSLLESERAFSDQSSCLLYRPVSQLFPNSIITISPEEPIAHACGVLAQQGFEYGLVCDSRDSIHGVLDRRKVQELIRSGGRGAAGLRVASCLSRNISLEPDSAHLGDILDRLIHGSSPYLLIVDRLGQPTRVLTGSVVLAMLQFSEGLGEQKIGRKLNRIAS